MKYITIILCIALSSCTADIPIEPITVTEVIQNTPEGINADYTLEGIYRRSIGSQWEVSEIAEQLTVYIQTGDSRDKIFQADYSYSKTDIIIDGCLYPYELDIEKIVICGYTYYRF